MLSNCKNYYRVFCKEVNLYFKGSLERARRIELLHKPWQGFKLPLHHARINLFMAEGLGLEPRSKESKSSILPLDDPSTMTARY